MQGWWILSEEMVHEYESLLHRLPKKNPWVMAGYWVRPWLLPICQFLYFHTQSTRQSRHCDPRKPPLLQSGTVASTEWTVDGVCVCICLQEGRGMCTRDGYVSLPVCSFSGVLFFPCCEHTLTHIHTTVLSPWKKRWCKRKERGEMKKSQE